MKSAPKSTRNWHNFSKKPENDDLVTQSTRNWHNFLKKLENANLVA